MKFLYQLNNAARRYLKANYKEICLALRSKCYRCDFGEDLKILYYIHRKQLTSLLLLVHEADERDLLHFLNSNPQIIVYKLLFSCDYPPQISQEL